MGSLPLVFTYVQSWCTLSLKVMMKRPLGLGAATLAAFISVAELVPEISGENKSPCGKKDFLSWALKAYRHFKIHNIISFKMLF